MIKLLLPLLLLTSVPATEARAGFDLDRVALQELRGLELPAAPAVTIPLRAGEAPQDRYFNAYILKAVEHLRKHYGLQGYDINSILTHDIQYHDQGVLKARRPPLTMCVAAVMEVMLTAYELYAQETGDYSPYYYLPRRSYEGLAITDIKGHIWVNHAFKADGTADALINFGMGERRVFEELRPGDFVNINRTTRTGHAVVFIGFINKTGKMLAKYDDTVVGFKYFSSQGLREAGQGGFDYRYAVFSKFGCPEMPYKRDCNVIYSTSQLYLNTGTMLAPSFWTGQLPQATGEEGETMLNRSFFNGVTTDD